MSKFEICTDDDGDMVWELRTKNDKVVARGGENMTTKVHPRLGVRFAKMVAKNAKVTECETE
jgi:uncharacterized protein YegP (UPF0339 family)